METFGEFMDKVLAVFPDAMVEEQAGQLVIYPGLRELPDGTVGRIIPES